VERENKKDINGDILLYATHTLHKTTNIVHKYITTLFMYNALRGVTLHLYFYGGQYVRNQDEINYIK
jgi:hypothetical protein